MCLFSKLLMAQQRCFSEAAKPYTIQPALSRTNMSRSARQPPAPSTMLPQLHNLPPHLNRAFSAPRICTVEAGYLARLVREPAWLMRRAPTVSPISADKLGATTCIFSSRYVCSFWRYSANAITRPAKRSMLMRSMGLMSCRCNAWATGKMLQVSTLGQYMTRRQQEAFVYESYHLECTTTSHHNVVKPLTHTPSMISCIA